MRIRVGPFEAAGANLDGNSLCCGVPSPLAALGFADALSRRAGGPGAPDSEACVIVHTCQVSEGQIKPAVILAGKGRVQNAEIPERVIGFVRATLILSNLPEIDEEFLHDAVPGMRFCGAPIFPMRSASRIPVSILADDNPGTLFGGLPRGFALVPRPDLASPAFGSAGEIDGLCEHLARFEECDWRRKTPGWIVPVPIGYRALQDLVAAVPRASSRDPYVPHIFVEDAAGLAEFVSIRRLAREPELSVHPFWRWAIDRPTGLFLAHPDFSIPAARVTHDVESEHARVLALDTGQ